MQHILNDEEYNALKRPQRELTFKLQKACTIIAERIRSLETPKTDPFRGHQITELRELGCSLNSREAYCSKCPVNNICPNDEKRWR